MKHLGEKTGQGFYKYDSEGKPVKKANISSDEHNADITDRMIMIFLNEAVKCLREKVVENADLLDAGMIFGTGFAPFRGGPMHYAHERGITEVVERMRELAQKYGERFNPDSEWETMIVAGPVKDEAILTPDQKAEAKSKTQEVE